MACIMKWADAEVMPDMASGWLEGSTPLDEIPGLNIDQVGRDLRCVLVEKAVGTVHTKVVNGMPKEVCTFTRIFINGSRRLQDLDSWNKSES